MKKKTFLVIALGAMGAMSLMAETVASAIESKKQLLYSTAADGSAPYRIPALAVLNNDEIMAVADYRPDGNDIGGYDYWITSKVYDVDIYAKFGTIDALGNYSWNPNSNSPAKSNLGTVIANGDSNTGYGDAAIAVDRTTGSAKVLIMSAAGQVSFSSASTSDDYRCYRHVSNDNGRTWSKTNMTTTFRGSSNVLTGSDNVSSMFFASGRLLQSSYKKTGSSYYRIYGAMLVRISSTNYNYVVYTDDFGETWTRLGSGSCCNGGNEAKLEELPNGQIVLSSRKASGRYFNVFTYDEGGFDAGTGSWYINNAAGATCTFNGEAGSSGADTNGELLLYKDLHKVGENGEISSETYDVLLQSLPIDGSSRAKVSVYYKEIAKNTTFVPNDFTSGWTKGIQVDDGASAYSTMAILPNGQIGFMYEDDYSTSYDGGDAEIYFVPLTVEEITGGAYTLEEPETVVVETPSITPNGGTYESSATVTIACATEGATIYYTIDGTTPSATNGTSYTAPFTLSTAGTYTVKAIAVKEGCTDSEVAVSATFTVTQPVTPVDPTISLSAASSTLTVGGTTQLTLDTNSDGAVTYTSSDESVATVSATGVVTAVSAGTATITATVAETDKYNVASATCEITVNAAESGGEGGSEEGGSGDGSGDDTEETKTYTPKLLDGQIGTTTFHLVTFSATEAVTIPSGVKAYYVKETDDAGAKLARLSGTVIPAEMGVILMGTGSGTIELKTTTTTVSAPDDNLLVGTLDEVNPVLSSTDYILAVKGSGDLAGKFAFCQLTDNYTVEDYANRAYLSLATTATRSITLSFDDEEGGTTAIDEVEETVDTPAEYYTLQGVKVEADKLTPGIYIMKHHGKARKVCF